MKRSLLVALLLVAGCGDTIVNNVPTGPSQPAPTVVRTTIEFRVQGNASSVRVRYSSPTDGLNQVVAALPYFNSFVTTADSMFLSLEATPIAYPFVLDFPFLSVEIVTGGTMFRQATSNEFFLNPLLISGTWRR